MSEIDPFHRPGQFPTALYLPFDGITAKVPPWLNDCFCYIHSHPPVEGMFRINGSVKRINNLHAHLGLAGRLDNADCAFTVHDVCGVLKKQLKNYLPTINGLYPLTFVDKLLAHEDDGSSVELFKTAYTSADDHACHLIDAVCSYMEEVPTFKNNLLLYIVSNLHTLAKVEVQTKMSPLNLAIVFQPYLFFSDKLPQLLVLQEILLTLIAHYPTFVAAYVHHQAALLVDVNHDLELLELVDSESVLPITNASAPNDLVYLEEAPRRKSISNRLSMFVDSKKRFSFTSRSDLRDDSRQPSLLSRHLSLGRSTDSLVASTRATSFSKLSDALTKSTAPTGPKESRRRSFIGIFRSPSSRNSLRTSVARPQPSRTTSAPYGKLNESIDDLLITDKRSLLINADQKSSLLGRNFSLRLKKNF